MSNESKLFFYLNILKDAEISEYLYLLKHIGREMQRKLIKHKEFKFHQFFIYSPELNGILKVLHPKNRGTFLVNLIESISTIDALHHCICLFKIPDYYKLYDTNYNLQSLLIRKVRTLIKTQEDLRKISSYTSDQQHQYLIEHLAPVLLTIFPTKQDLLRFIWSLPSFSSRRSDLLIQYRLEHRNRATTHIENSIKLIADLNTNKKVNMQDVINGIYKYEFDKFCDVLKKLNEQQQEEFFKTLNRNIYGFVDTYQRLYLTQSLMKNPDRLNYHLLVNIKKGKDLWIVIEKLWMMKEILTFELFFPHLANTFKANVAEALNFHDLMVYFNLHSSYQKEFVHFLGANILKLGSYDDLERTEYLHTSDYSYKFVKEVYEHYYYKLTWRGYAASLFNNPPRLPDPNALEKYHNFFLRFEPEASAKIRKNHH